MENRTISLRQMLTVVFLALFPLGTETLFQPLAGAGAAGWLCPLLAGGIAVGLAWVVGHRERIHSIKDMGRWLALLLLLWGLFFGAAQACRIGMRLADPLGASPVLMTVALLALASWLAAGGLPAFARTCEIFLLALGSGLALIIVGGIFRLEWDWVLLWTWEELGRVPLGGAECLGLLAVGVYGLLFWEEVVPEERRLRRVCSMMGRLGLLLAVAGILILGRFGAALTGRMERPFFQMVSGLGLEGAFQRLEQLVSALWILGDLALLGFLLLALVRLTGLAAGKERKGGWAWIWCVVLILLALPLDFWQDVLAGPILWVGTLAAGGLILAVFGRKPRN